ncbi:MAG: efflux RND transporter permease subunit [Fibrobacterota bacterium]
MDLIQVSIKKPLMMIMIILAVSMFGFVAWRGLPIDTMPDMDLPYVTVQAVYPGASPTEVEDNIVKPMEEQLSTIGGIKHITSYGMDNAGYLVLQFNDDVVQSEASNDVKDKIDKIINDLPEDMQEPIVTEFDPGDEPVVTLAVTGQTTPEKLRRYVDQNIKDEFGKISGVAKVDVTGGREREILVDLDKERMASHNLSIFSVLPLLENQNLTLPAGRLIGERREYSVKTDGKFTSLKEIGDLRIPVHKKYGKKQADYTVRLNEIAQIHDSSATVRSKVRFNGEEAVKLAIQKSADGNTAAIAEGIIALTEKLKEDLPEEIDIHVIEDKSTFISDSVEGTYSNIYMGIVLTAVILFIFLFDWRLTLIVGITMPVSLIMAMIGVDAMGFTLNMVTMMALTISVGVLVTNSIVVIENIVRHRNTGQNVKKAAEEGSREIFTSVFASTLTNLAVFIPIANTTGIIGSVFQSLGLTIVFATLASLFLSFTLVPLMASRLLKQKRVDTSDHSSSHALDRALAFVDKIYAHQLNNLLRNIPARIVVILATIGLLVYTLMGIAPQLGSEFAPPMDRGFVTVHMELPPGTPLEVTEDLISKIEESTQKISHMEAVSSSIGGSGTETGVQYGSVKIKVTPEDERDVTSAQIAAMIRPDFADFPDANISVTASSDVTGAGGDIILELIGDDMNELQDYSDEVMDILQNDIDGLADFSSSWKGTKPQILLTPRRDMLEHYGLNANLAASATVQSVAGALRYNITGNSDAKYTENNEDYPIRIQLKEKYRQNIQDIRSMDILTPRGYVELEEIFHVELTEAISKVTRKDRQKMIQISCNVLEGDPGTMVGKITERLDKLGGYDNSSFRFGGNQEMQKETNEQLSIAGLLAVLLTLMVLIGLLESITMGLVIFLTIPLGLIGVIWGLFLTGNNVSMISSLSMIMLIGIVVNNAILLIDYARMQRHKRGIGARRAIVEAAEVKLKPILMSNLAIIISMVPMALSLGSGGSFRAPFAVTAIAGVIVSTALTFFVIPILYVATAAKTVVADSE